MYYNRDTHPDKITPAVTAVPATPAIARVAAYAGVHAKATPRLGSFQCERGSARRGCELCTARS
jgi:hypothetical protein